MFRLTVISLIALVSLSAFARENSVDGFNSRFNLVRNAEGKVTVIKLKRATRFFTIKPFIEQIKNDLLEILKIEDKELEYEIFRDLSKKTSKTT